MLTFYEYSHANFLTLQTGEAIYHFPRGRRRETMAWQLGSCFLSDPDSYRSIGYVHMFGANLQLETFYTHP